LSTGGGHVALFHQLREVAVLCNDDRAVPSCLGENDRIACREEVEVLDMSGVRALFTPKPHRKRWRELSVDPESQQPRLAIGSLIRRILHAGLRCENWVIHLARGIEKACRDVIRLEIGIVREDLLLGLPRGKQLEDVKHAQPHPTNAGTTAALLGVDSDPA
jgi:hypothetical protein